MCPCAWPMHIFLIPFLPPHGKRLCLLVFCPANWISFSQDTFSHHEVRLIKRERDGFHVQRKVFKKCRQTCFENIKGLSAHKRVSFHLFAHLYASNGEGDLEKSMWIEFSRTKNVFALSSGCRENARPDPLLPVSVLIFNGYRNSWNLSGFHNVHSD